MNSFRTDSFKMDYRKMLKKNKCIIIISFAVVFHVSLFLSGANAAPSISSVSGDFSKNGQVKITGSGFGTKSPVAPVLWDDLESGTPSSAWSKLETGVKVVSAAGQLPNSRYSFRVDKGAGDGSIDMEKKYTITNKFYTFVKRRYDYSIGSDNHKFFRVYQSAGNNSIIWNYNWGTAYQMRNSYTPMVDPNNPAPSYVIKLGAQNFPAVGQWQTEEFFVKAETAIGAYNGVMGYRLNNNQHRSWAANRKMFDKDHNYPLSHIFVDNFSNRISLGLDKPGDYIWIDSVYMDNTWARVVIGDSAVYDNCSKKLEIQYPLTWSSNTITVKFNPGTFSKGQPAYLYVFDANNSISNSTKFTIGGSGTGSPSPINVPPAPDLRVAN